jgi:RHS repeat-associated protein
MALKRSSSWFGLSISHFRFSFFQSHHRPKNSRARQILPTFVALILFSWGTAKALHAQTLPSTSSDDLMGMQPYQSYHGGDIDSISLTTGMLNLNFPFLSYPQRGKLHLSFNLFYNDQAQHIGTLCFVGKCSFLWGTTQIQSPLPLEKGDVFVGWAQQMDALGTMTSVVNNQGQSDQITTYWGNWSIQHADGSKHILGNRGASTRTGTNPFYYQGNGPWETLDGSGWRTNATFTATASNVGSAEPASFVDPDGVVYNAPNGAAEEDPNGNTITTTATGFLDSLDRQIPTPPTVSSPSNTTTSACPQTLLPVDHAVLWAAPGPNGSTVDYTFCYADVAINRPPVGGASGSSSPGSALKLQSIVLPNGQSWNFQYNDPGDGTTYNGEPINYGTLTQVTLPTGGTISYTYSMETGAVSACQMVGRWVASRSVNANDGTGAHSWTYSYVLNTGGAGNSTTVTDPLGNYVVHTFSSIGSCQPYETQTQYFQNGGALLKTVVTAYNGVISRNAGPSGMINVVPTTVTTTWPNGKVSAVTKTYDAGFSYLDFLGDSTNPNSVANVGIYGKVLTQTESDFGGTVLRTTTNTYQALNSSTYLANNLLNLPASIKVTGASQTNYTTYNYDEAGGLAGSGITVQHDSAPPTGTARGNQTSIHRQLNNGSAVATTSCPTAVSSGGYLVSNIIFFDTGEVNVSKDPCTFATTYAYSGTYFGAFPATITNALNQSTTHAYDLNTGLVTSTTDPNGQTTSFTYDSMWRLASATYPDGGSSVITRQETSFPDTATLTKKLSSSPALSYVSTSVFDGLGRETQSELTSDPSGTDITNTTYDADGRKASVTNPYRTSGNVVTSTEGTTSYQYDGLNRPTLVTKPDGSTVHTAYCGGSSTLVTDEAGHWRRSSTDGLGRLIEVDEPNSLTATVSANGCPGSGDPIWVTTYTYDGLDDLTSVSQGASRPRSFIFDSLKRLTSSTNPETGTTPVTYTYDADSNVHTKSDARGITITYGWDTLNRMTSRMYSNSDPAVAYTYDQTTCVVVASCYNIGRRTGTTDAGGSEAWAYDKMGREIGEKRTTNAITKNTSYSYNLDGSLATLTYPSGRTISYTYNAAAQPTQALDNADEISYASNGFYIPSGALMTLSYSTTVNATFIYNSRLQPCWIATDIGSPSLVWNTPCTGTATPGTILDLKYNFNPGADNGNVVAITNNRDTTRSQAFTYDQVNRITTAQTPTPCASNCWSQTFTYDQWANLQAVAATGTAPPLTNLAVNTSNRITLAGFTYDAAGNETTDVTNTYVWNAEGEIKTGGAVNYTYDGDGDRVQKSNGKIYWYGAGSQVLDESDASGNITDEYVYFGGKRVAHRVVSSNSFYFYVEDMLGSSRALATSAGALCYDADFYPYGGEHDYTNTCSQNYKFTGKERDPETNNDDFDARYYSSAYGRFLSADWSSTPSPVPYANLTNPQTLNLYAMVSDNPESFADLDGHKVELQSNTVACAAGGSESCEAQEAAAQKATTVSPIGSTTIITKQDGQTTLTQTTLSNITVKDANGNVTATGSEKTTTSITVDNKGTVLGGTTQTTLRLNDSSGQDISPAAGAVQDLTPLRATQALGLQQTNALQDSVTPSFGQRLLDHKIGIGGTAVGGGIAIGCVLAEPCGAAVTITGIGIATGSAIYDMLTH